ncbi:phosphoenolpyruvate--protein phosphotransferase [Brooklawnia cerclae]|uniref:Phosphocarrier protein HPr n=1 Tax=Brooklawnia cerclae TaxID=349934 RepID=A0ABX0SCI6_9ACTN|nr:phosphocarrier protein FPr [Brooklawnia cerclae]
MIGIVVVSHSRALADAAVALAHQVVPNGGPQIAVAAGLSDGTFGTDAAAISLAIAKMDTPDGVLVLLDLGSALLSSELAIEFLDDAVAEHVRISGAPLVEGLLAAVVLASTGASLEEVDAEARRSLTDKQAHLGHEDDAPAPITVPKQVPEPQAPAPERAIIWRTTVRNPHGLHVRPAAAIVTEMRDFDAQVLLSNATTGRGPEPADRLSRITALQLGQGHILEARFTGPDAAAARDALADLAARHFGEDLDARPVRPAHISPVVDAGSADQLNGSIAADRLTVVGRIARRTTRPSTEGYRPGPPKAELARFTAAVAQVKDFFDALVDSGVGIPGIIEAQTVMLTDRELQHGVVSRITQGFSAVDAVDEHLTGLARSFDGFADAYLRERGQDMRSLRRMLLLALMGRPLLDSAPSEPRIWLMDELDAATASRVDPRVCLGIITVSGGSSGHGVLTARARGIPVLAGYPSAESLGDGVLVAFDPVTRQLWVDPDDDVVAGLGGINEERFQESEQAHARAQEPAVTTTGIRIRVGANVSSLADAERGAEEGAEGSGIVRSEILFSAATTAPTADEQAEVYTRIGQALNGPITLRTWDPADDKPLPFLPHDPVTNPALGERGIRVMRRAPEVFREQLRAILLTASRTPVRLMLPMVTTVDEVVWARGLVDELRAEIDAPHVPIGMMVEVPGAAIRAADFAGVVDFVSIGTNDLTQYTQAADRGNPAVCDLARQDSPAILDLVAWTCKALPGIPVAVCGDLASDPTATARLIGFGVSELSVRPPIVAEIKQAVRVS